MFIAKRFFFTLMYALEKIWGYKWCENQKKDFCFICVHNLSIFILYEQKLFGNPMAEFHISLLCMWSKNGTFEELT